MDLTESVKWIYELNHHLNAEGNLVLKQDTRGGVIHGIYQRFTSFPLKSPLCKWPLLYNENTQIIHHLLHYTCNSTVIFVQHHCYGVEIKSVNANASIYRPCHTYITRINNSLFILLFMSNSIRFQVHGVKFLHQTNHTCII